MKRVAIVQSNYIPWKGYFDLINMVDEFILYDSVQYTTRDWRNRNLLKSKNGTQWVTIPVSHKSPSQKIRDTRTVSHFWRRKHWTSVCHWYSKAAFFKTYKEIFEKLYMGSNEVYLSEINHTFIRAINDILGITTKISRSDDYELIESGKTERGVDLCKQAGATEYLSGPAAKAYLDESIYAAAGISVSWMNYDGYPEYRQLFCPPFHHNVSIVDLIFNEGAEGARRCMLSFTKKEGVSNHG
jgi:hypothetical protein